MPEIVIRPIVQSELNQYLKIARQMQQRDKSLNIMFMRSYRDAIDAQNIYMAFYRDKPVGLLMLYWYKKSPALKIEQIASLRKGMGRKLLVFALELAKQRGNVETLRLEVRKDNTNAIGFYEHFGMTRDTNIKKELTYAYTLKVN